MGIDTVHQIAPVVINSVVIPDITSLTINTGTETFREVVAGSTLPQLSRIVRVRPSFQFTTKAVKIALDTLGVTASCSSGSQTAVAYLAKRQCNGIAAAGNHEAYTLPNYIVVPRTLTCRHPNDAEISYEVFGVIDPLLPTVPIIDRATSQNLPATIGTDNRWYMNAASHGNVTIVGKLSETIDFGTTLIQESSDGDIEDTFVGIDNTQPRVTISGRTVDWFGEVGSVIPTVEGVAGTHANSEILLRKRGDAESATTHIQITFAGLGYVDNAASGQGAGPTDHGLVIEPSDDGVNSIFELDTSYQITAP